MLTIDNILLNKIGLTEYILVPFKEYIRITTPWNFGDGDILDLYIKTIDNKQVLTDLGTIYGNISNQLFTYKSPNTDTYDSIVDKIYNKYSITYNEDYGWSYNIEDIPVLSKQGEMISLISGLMCFQMAIDELLTELGFPILEFCSNSK